MGNCLTFSKKYNKMDSENYESAIITKSNVKELTDASLKDTSIEETNPRITVIENYIDPEYSMSHSMETSNKLDNLIEDLENYCGINQRFSSPFYENSENNRKTVDTLSFDSETYSEQDTKITKSDDHWLVFDSPSGHWDKINRRHTI